MKLSEYGEFALIERIISSMQRDRPDDVIVGPGDDAAVWRWRDDYVVATTDTMVAGVHFLTGVSPWMDVGWKAAAVNVSDIAAMGGWPRYALVTLALPPDFVVADIDELYEGLSMYLRMCGAHVAGGDIVRASEMSVTVALYGWVEVGDGGEPLLLRRSTARPGDLIAVTGSLGESAAGLRRLREGAPPTDDLVSRHLRPSARLAEGGIAVQAGITCGMDVSDGLVQDLGHICKASGVGAVVRAADLPISDAVREAYPDDALTLACTGGEDYELLLIGEEGHLHNAMAQLDGQAITVIGEIVKDYDRRARVLDEAGKEIRFDRSGWDAFRS